jgi:hypothetical protein
VIRYPQAVTRVLPLCDESRIRTPTDGCPGFATASTSPGGERRGRGSFGVGSVGQLGRCSGVAATGVVGAHAAGSGGVGRYAARVISTVIPPE